MKERRKREIPEETRRPAASCGTIPTCKNPGVTRPGTEPGPPWWEEHFNSESRGLGSVTVRLLASHLGKPGSIPDGVAPGFSHVRIVSDDAAGRRVFSGISRFPRPRIPAQFFSHFASPTSSLKTSMLRAAQISSLTHSTSGAYFPYIHASVPAFVQETVKCYKQSIWWRQTPLSQCVHFLLQTDANETHRLTSHCPATSLSDSISGCWVEMTAWCRWLGGRGAGQVYTLRQIKLRDVAAGEGERDRRRGRRGPLWSVDTRQYCLRAVTSLRVGGACRGLKTRDLGEILKVTVWLQVLSTPEPYKHGRTRGDPSMSITPRRRLLRPCQTVKFSRQIASNKFGQIKLDTYDDIENRHKLYDEPGRKDGPVKEDFWVFDFGPRTTRCLVFGEPILREECYWLRILEKFRFCTHLRCSGPQRTSSLGTTRRCSVRGERESCCWVLHHVASSPRTSPSGWHGKPSIQWNAVVNQRRIILSDRPWESRCSLLLSTISADKSGSGGAQNSASIPLCEAATWLPSRAAAKFGQANGTLVARRYERCKNRGRAGIVLYGGALVVMSLETRNKGRVGKEQRAYAHASPSFGYEVVLPLYIDVTAAYSPFTVTSTFSEALLKFYFQDIPQPLAN
ncbi:hypothetical protein PR048_016732 [Dryococelus australis]|uniref:Uncharacterized protein n=1 Tax=Dryococelus australis TaxID=614101 RepID=A0ABQ9H7R2_9NEOP|nr:hypothetical protein PR048_016732 [Dryococelus australis]